MHLIQIRCAAFELLVEPPLLRLLSGYQREDDQTSRSSSFVGRGNLRRNSPILLDFLQPINHLQPEGWSIVARDQISEQEWSFGFWWPIVLRPHEARLPGGRETTVHIFAGAGEAQTARMIIRWREPEGVKVEWKFRDRTIDEMLLPVEQVQDGRLDAEIQRNLSKLIPMSLPS